jgi:eukaryotic-like serine/threonine-protein kinase
MMLPARTRLGPYEILGALGAGGMGEVYRARDSRLDRDVAIKILPELFAADPDRLMRFAREAKTLAALNHPGIAQIYGIEEAPPDTAGQGARALVMELVEGEDLSQVIARGPVPLDQALPIARQIAEALEAAHEAGVVHRDLKPANIKVRGDGAVKVLDFGLAKAPALAASGSGPLAHSPTFTSPAMTQMGVILGTAAYMAPEQAKGRPVDKRADIWAFGVVLYEMLSGRRLFEAEDVSEVLAAVLTREVDDGALPPGTPARLRSLVRDCLVRDPARRLRDIGDARIVLDRLIAGGAEAADTPPLAAPLRARATRAWQALALAASLVAIALAAVPLRQPPAPPAPMVRFSVPLPPGAWIPTFAPIRLSPDGTRLAAVVSARGTGRVWVHTFATGSSTLLETPEEVLGAMLAWSPDGEEIAFSSPGKLRKIPAAGGPTQVIGTWAPEASYSGAWGRGDVILLGPRNQGPLLRGAVPAGTFEPVTTLDETLGERRHMLPSFLPDGRRFVYVAIAGPSRAAYLESLDGGTRRVLPGITSEMRYAPSGHLLHLADGALVAQPFDLTRGEMSGRAITVADRVALAGSLTGSFDVSASGTVAFVAFPADRESQLTWFDRTGRGAEKAGPPGRYADIDLSPDGRRVAFEAGLPGDIFVLDLVSGITERITFGAEREADPVWSPDGRRVAFRSNRDGRMYARTFGESGEPELLLESDTRDSPAAWTPGYLVYESGVDVWALPESGDRTPVRLTSGTTEKGAAQVSPDGRWLAYTSNEGGRVEVFVQSFPRPGFRRQVSSRGGGGARWSPDGRELYYVSADSVLMAVAVRPAGDTLDIDAPVELFKTDMSPDHEPEFTVAPDGRFLINVRNAARGSEEVTVILNWRPGGER